MVPFSMTLSDGYLTQISTLRYYSTSNNSKMVQDRAIVTTTDQYEVVHSLSIVAVFNDLERDLG